MNLFLHLFFVTGLGSFYSELMKGLGASTRIWNLIDQEPGIALKGISCSHNILSM